MLLGNIALSEESVWIAARSAGVQVPAALLPLLLGVGLALVDELLLPQPATASPRALTAISSATPENSPHLLVDLIPTPFVGGSPRVSPQCSYLQLSRCRGFVTLSAVGKRTAGLATATARALRGYSAAGSPCSRRRHPTSRRRSRRRGRAGSHEGVSPYPFLSSAAIPGLLRPWCMEATLRLDDILTGPRPAMRLTAPAVVPSRPPRAAADANAEAGL